MRVGILTYGLDRTRGGIGRYAVELVRALAKLHNRPDMMLLTAGGAGPLVELGLPTVRLPGCKLLPGLMSLGNGLLPLLARRHKLDLIHDTIGVTPLAVGGGRAKTLVTVHDVIPWSFPGMSTTLDTWIYRRWLPRVLPGVNGVITVSTCSKGDIAAYLNTPMSKIHVILEGVGEHFQPAHPDQITQVKARYGIAHPYILYVGSVEERKNLRRVLHAYAELVNFPHQLVIVGAQKWKYEAINETFSTLNLGERVVFTGHVAEADLPALYSGAEVFVFPSLYEGFGLPVLEAMACGTPVVTSNVSSLPEVAGDAALFVDPYDTDTIAEAIRTLLVSPELRRSLREKGRARASLFTWEQTAHQTAAIYEQICS